MKNSNKNVISNVINFQTIKFQKKDYLRYLVHKNANYC